MITVIDLNYSKNPFPGLSQELLDMAKATLDDGKKILIYLNKRGEANALICKDCSYQAKCSECDMTMRVHKYPEKKLICHNCNHKEDIPMNCPKCGGSNILSIGNGTQRLEDAFIKIFPGKTIARLDSDKVSKEGIALEDIKNAQIIVATEAINTIGIDDLGLLCIPLFEMELIIPEYDIEEKIYLNIAHNLKRGSSVVIQTFIPDHELLKILTQGNYKEFLEYTLKERKAFGYPPYKDFANIWIHAPNKDRINMIAAKTLNKLEILDEERKYSIIYDKDSYSKKNGELRQKISVRGENLKSFLDNIALEVIRNREMEIEWK